MKEYKGIIFDLDGTLINSLEDISDSVNIVLKELGYPTFDYDRYRFFVGNGFRSLVTQCLPEDKRDEESVSQLFSLAMDVYGKRCTEKTYLYDGIPELLDRLCAEGIKMAVLSNKPDSLTRKISDILLDKWKFEIIMGAGDSFPRKPDPASSLHIARVMGIEPEKIIYVGDSDVDMKTAGAAGFYAVGVTWGFRPRAELEASGADLIIDHPGKLPIYY